MGQPSGMEPVGMQAAGVGLHLDRERSAPEPSPCASASSAVLLVGGTRSGKSDLALRFAEGKGPERLFVATALVRDAETRARRERHRAQRGQGWRTLEAPLEVLSALQDNAHGNCAVVLDCITFWLCNMQEQGRTNTQILDAVQALAGWLTAPPVPVVVVSSELGQGIVPATPLGRAFRDLAGEANQVLAAGCATVLLVSCGLPMALKGRIPKELII